MISALDVLHGVVNRHTVGDGAAGAVDIQLNLLVRVLRLQIQKLGHYQAGRCGVHFFTQEDDAVVEQAGKNIVGPLSPIGLLNYIWN